MRKHANLKTADARAEYTQIENTFIPVAPSLASSTQRSLLVFEEWHY
jgi:hypothetical protein